MEHLKEIYEQGVMPLHRLGVLYFFAFAVGASVGSFLNVFIYRWPREMSVAEPRRSFCPACGRQIPWYLNVPIVSWIMLRGKCRWCGARISAQYLLVELGTALWFTAVLWKFGPGLSALALFTFGAALLGASVIDLYIRLLPDVITYGLIPLGIGMAFLKKFAPAWPVPWPDAVIGALAGPALFIAVLVIFKAITGKDGMGWGDVKLIGAIGAFIGYPALPASIFIASVGGIAAWLILRFSRHVDREYHLPFGPLLALGALAVVMTREWLTRNWVIISWDFWWKS